MFLEQKVHILRPSIPKVGDRIRFNDGVPGRATGIVIAYDGNIIEVQWGENPNASTKDKYDMQYFIHRLMIVTEPNDALKEIL